MADRAKQAARAVREIAMLVGRSGLKQEDAPRLSEPLRNATAWLSLAFMLEAAGDNPNVQWTVIGECRKQKRALIAFINAS